MREVWIAGSLLWLAGVALRLSILAVPPVIALIQSDLRLSGTEVGVLSGLPLVLIAILTLALAPARKPPAPSAPAALWWPDWRNPLTWQIGILLGSVNSVYFASNTFLPGHLTEAGRPDLISAALTALNFGQLPASFALLATADRFVRRAWPFIVCGGLILLCLAGFVMTASLWTVACAGGLGFLRAVVFT